MSIDNLDEMASKGVRVIWEDKGEKILNEHEITIVKISSTKRIIRGWHPANLDFLFLIS